VLLSENNLVALKRHLQSSENKVPAGACRVVCRPRPVRTEEAGGQIISSNTEAFADLAYLSRLPF
jgi:hypothetical protein